jgi:hypothetical protein
MRPAGCRFPSPKSGREFVPVSQEPGIVDPVTETGLSFRKWMSQSSKQVRSKFRLSVVSFFGAKLNVEWRNNKRENLANN